ncbi:MAG: exodeoxyribonuclease III [Candidatus Latescibacteria bacterium]|jgi:exodeoxyribonuclease III|nr:exodeoxyribonuclease III [Candidatus Latescibacterota bacterium]MBT4138064.1 exodeoxyribonuclease III [Candidatus Latescibacterota bacterium]
MRIITWNVNGLRAAIRKGIQDHINTLNPDVILFQEVRALPEQLPKEWADPEGWHVIWHPAQKKGYAGTAVWSRHPITKHDRGIGTKDTEGRVLHVSTAGIDVVSVYLPSGSSGDERQNIKEQWMAQFRPWADKLKRKRKPVLMGGDFNIVHTERDIFYAKGNAKTSGFLPHERAWIGDLIDSGWHDFLRESVGDIQGPYSWWSNRGKARELDRGWRIDYLLGNAAASKQIETSSIYREGGLTISDHAPVIVDLK